MAFTAQQSPFAFHVTPWVKRLLIANTVAFFLSLIIGMGFVVEWFAFSPSHVLTRPWGALTYMFLHGDMWHLLVNMLVLFFFGPPLESRWGSREFIRYYLVCGLGGVALSFLFVNHTIIGASAATYGIMLAFAMNWPESPIYIWGIFPVQARWLMAFLFAVSLVSAFGGGGGGIAHFAHLGGVVTGFLYLKSDLRFGRAPTASVRVRTSRRFAIVPGEEKEGRADRQASRRAEGSSADEKAILDAVDQVLDKISAHGMQSLTPEERELLDRVSRQRRTN